jgi:hypothetical protein
MVERTRNSIHSPVVQWLVGLILAALVAYFTTTSAIQTELAEAKATESSHFEEVLRRLDALQEDIRELRGRP